MAPIGGGGEQEQADRDDDDDDEFEMKRTAIELLAVVVRVARRGKPKLRNAGQDAQLVFLSLARRGAAAAASGQLLHAQSCAPGEKK